MIEKIILDFLNENLGVPVCLEETEEEKEYVLIEKTSGRGGFIKKSTIAIQSCSSSLYMAASLNDKVTEVMETCVQLDDITKCELNSSYNYSDTARKKYRYQAVFDIVHY